MYRLSFALLLTLLLSACGTRSVSDSDGADPLVMSDGAVPSPALWPCLAPAWQEPTEVIAFSDRHATAPSMVVLESGAVGKPPQIAIQVAASGGSSPLHPDLQIARLQLDPGIWPEALVLDRAPQLLGDHAHGWGEMVRTDDGVDLGWHGDLVMNQGRPRLRRMSAATWTATATVDVWPESEAVLALAASSTGLAMAWRDVQSVSATTTTSRPMMALLDAQGQVVAGPWPGAQAEPYPGRTVTLTHSSTHFLAAAGYVRCEDGPGPCQPHAVGVLRIDPQTGPMVATWLPTANPGGAPGRRIALSAMDGEVWAAWSETGVDASGPQSLHVARLAADGTKRLGPVQVASGVHPISSPRLAATRFGLVLVWAEANDTTLPLDQPGRSRLMLLWLDLDGSPLHGPDAYPVTQIDTYGPPDVVALDEPRGLLITWSGASRTVSQVHDVAYVAGVDCSGGMK